MAPTALLDPSVDVQRRGRFRDRRRERRRLADIDRYAADRAERTLLGAVLADAGGLVDAGWVQHCWFVVEDGTGRPHRIGAQNLGDLHGRAVTDVCLVGAIVEAAGGVAHAGTQPVHRALDLTWATLFNEPVRWCPPPAVRLAHVHDLTRWNDTPGRSASDVSGLLALSCDRALPGAHAVH